jgi:hypothetical protein
MPDLGPANPTYSFREHMPNATIRYITDLAAADAALAELDLQGPLGFDLEWRPTFIKGGLSSCSLSPRMCSRRWGVTF